MCRRQHWSATLTPSACYWHAPHLVAQSWYQWQSRSWGAPICSSWNTGWRSTAPITVTPCWHNRCYLQSVACLVIDLYSSKTVSCTPGTRHDSASTQGNAKLHRTRTLASKFPLPESSRLQDMGADKLPTSSFILLYKQEYFHATRKYWFCNYCTNSRNAGVVSEFFDRNVNYRVCEAVNMKSLLLPRHRRRWWRTGHAWNPIGAEAC